MGWGWKAKAVCVYVCVVGGGFLLLLQIRHFHRIIENSHSLFPFWCLVSLMIKTHKRPGADNEDPAWRLRYEY